MNHDEAAFVTIGPQPIEYRSLSDMTAEKLRDAIITGRLQPGDRVTENGIAEILGVSRMVVREAILLLIGENLLEKEHNKFTRVITIERQDIADILDLRIAIEQAAVKRCMCAPDFINETVPALAAIADRLAGLVKSGTAEPLEMMYMDMSFHAYLVKASCNTRLLNVWNELSGPMLLLLYRYISAGFEPKPNYRHDDLIDAFCTMNAFTIYRSIEEHIEDTKLALMKNY